MAATKYFKNPFASAGDRAAVPETDPGDGSLNWSEGYSPDYQADYPDAPNSLALLRNQYNQVLYDTTRGIQQYQQFGTPNFISTSDNGGTPFSYSKYAYALYLGKIYQSLVDSNTALPTDTTKWRLVDDTDAQAVIYTNVVFDTSMGVAVVDGDAVYFNASGPYYSKALANGTITQNVIGIADVTNKRLFVLGLVGGFSGLIAGAIYYLSTSSAGGITNTVPPADAVQVGTALSATVLSFNPQSAVNGLEAAGFVKEYSGMGVPAGGYVKALGQEVGRSDPVYASLKANTTLTTNGTLSTGSPIITGIADTSLLDPGCPLSGTGIQTGSVIVSVDSSTQVTISLNATTSAVQSLFFAPNGVGNGTTTFNVKDKRNRTSVGSGTAPGFTPRYNGQQGGAEQELPTLAKTAGHAHGVECQASADGNDGGVASTNTFRSPRTNSTTTVGGGDPLEIMNPFTVSNYIVKI